VQQVESNEEKKARLEKDALQLKQACQRVFSSPDGVFIAKKMKDTCRVFDWRSHRSHSDYDRGMQAMYLMFVKGTLTPEQCANIECP